MSGVLISGIGINDIEGDAAENKSHAYRSWKSMLSRCYSEVYQRNKPTYIGCTVSDEWLTYSNFKRWMVSQCNNDGHLDKDLIVAGNKHYSSETCVFVDRQTNTILINRSRDRGKWPQGVSLKKGSSLFVSHCNENGKRIYLGCFKTPAEAEKAYLQYKSNIVKKCALRQQDIRVMNSLIEVAENMMIRSKSITEN